MTFIQTAREDQAAKQQNGLQERPGISQQSTITELEMVKAQKSPF